MVGVGCSLLWIYPMHLLWPLVVDYLTHDTYIVYVYHKGGHFNDNWGLVNRRLLPMN